MNYLLAGLCILAALATLDWRYRHHMHRQLVAATQGLTVPSWWAFTWRTVLYTTLLFIAAVVLVVTA